MTSLKEADSKSGHDTWQTVFLEGCPRSGKTMLHRLLARHPDFAWFSHYLNRYPRFPAMGALNQFCNFKFFSSFGSLENRCGLPVPFEAWNIWKQYAPRFGYEMGSLTEKDVDPAIRCALSKVIASQLKWQRKKKFITDYGRPCRMLFLNEIFPNSKFIHVLRDGRAVAYEILQMGWMDGLDNLKKSLVDVPDEHVKEWIDSGKDPKVAAGIRWKIALDEIEKQRPYILPENFLEVRYEEFVVNPKSILEKIMDFLNMEVDIRVLLALENIDLKNMNYKYEVSLNAKEKATIEKTIKASLIKYGYL